MDVSLTFINIPIVTVYREAISQPNSRLYLKKKKKAKKKNKPEIYVTGWNRKEENPEGRGMKRKKSIKAGMNRQSVSLAEGIRTICQGCNVTCTMPLNQLTEAFSSPLPAGGS